MGCAQGKGERDHDIDGIHASSKGLADGASDQAAAIIAGPGLTSRLHLSISCTGLANVDRGSLSDPFVVVSMKTEGEGSWTEIGRTEVVANNLNPSFLTLVPAIFRFEEAQLMQFHVYDVAGSFMTSDATLLQLDKQTSLGKAEFALASIMGAHGQTYMQALHAPNLPRQKANITVRAEQAKESSDLVVFELEVSGLPRKCRMMFARFNRTTESGDPIPCFRTEVAKVSNSSCRWREARVGLPILANGDRYRPLLVECVAYNNSGAHVVMGTCKMSVDDMISKASSGRKLLLSGGAGEVTILSCSLHPQPSFFDYLAGGMQLQFTVAIDYTASNGDPNLSSSLHYFDPSGRVTNQYEHAIRSVGSILEFYDADKRFPVVGFGGCPVPRQPAQHRFAVNGNEHDPEVEGIEGVLSIYRQSLRWVQLSGPTLFAPVICQAAAEAASLRTTDPCQQTYIVLMIMTDGIINDMDNTKDALVVAADNPMSVVIVGVGKADFAAMEELDGDTVRIKDTTGKPASRDIVQFVAMDDFKTKGFHALAREVLAEIPSQVVEYMHNNGIRPGPPATVPYGG